MLHDPVRGRGVVDCHENGICNDRHHPERQKTENHRQPLGPSLKINKINLLFALSVIFNAFFATVKPL